METADRRVRRTMRLLSQSLLELIFEKEYDKITISDVTDRADIGLRTFYRHYSNIDDLMLEIIKSHFQEYKNNMLTDYSLDAEIKNGTMLFQHVEKNWVLFSVLFQSRFSDDLIPLLKEQAMAGSAEIIKKSTKDPFMMDLIVNHIVSSVFSLIRWWIEKNQPYNTERMGRIYADLIINATKGFVENLAE